MFDEMYIRSRGSCENQSLALHMEKHGGPPIGRYRLVVVLDPKINGHDANDVGAPLSFHKRACIRRNTRAKRRSQVRAQDRSPS